MRFIISLLIVFSSLCPNVSKADTRDKVDKSTDVLMFATPAAGLITSLVLKDYQGTKQLVFGAATSVAASYLLKYTVNKRRPDGSDCHSFPSNHTALSFEGATFIGRRYGWKYSIPAYLVAGYVTWGRIYSKKHDGWDVAAGAAIGIGSSFLFTRSFAQKHKLAISPVTFSENQWGVYMSMVF